MRTICQLTLLLSLGGWTFSAWAQWSSQTIALQTGWNAVYLELQPEPRECPALMAGKPVASVWAWNRRFSSVQFIQDPTELVPGNPDWLAWSPGAGTTNLFALEGGRAYLIKATAPFNWQIQGRPIVRHRDWVSDSFNLVGFAVDAVSPPTYESFFAGSAAHAGQPIFRLSAAGHWDRVTDPAASTMRSGEGFWIRSLGPSAYGGPVKVEVEQGTALEYGRVLTEQRLRLRNESLVPRTLSVRRLSSGTPALTTEPELAGPVPLAYYRIDPQTQTAGWVSLPTPLTPLNLSPGEELILRLEVRRVEMNAYSPAPNGPGALYQSLLQITDGLGARELVGVTSLGLDATSNAHPRSGLWVGNAVIRKVNQAHRADSTNATPVATDYSFRLIVHVDRLGQPRLLQQVLQRWRRTTNSSSGRTVLLTDASRLSAADQVEGGRRISATAFAFREPIVLAGTGQFGAGRFGGVITNEFNDPLHPFKHRYHPDHDNLDATFDGVVPETFSFLRQLQLEFTPDDPEGLNVPGWGDDQVGGRYRETLTGVHRYALNVEGTFRLHRISRLAELNPSN
jgi:hypothetical protein